MEIIGDIWNEAIIRPMINSLVLLYWVFFSNFGLAIIVFTVLVRLGMVPLTIKQDRSMKAMSALQPKLKEIQAKYPNDRARASQETMALYRQEGVNPVGCLGPMVIQMPIFLGLFWALRGTLPSTPERLADLSRHLYPWLSQVHEAVPLDGKFLWMDLGKYSSDNPIPLLLPILVGSSMWLMQKMSAMPAASPQQESTNRMMLWMLPFMFGFFTLSFESGLAVYWIVSNVIGIVIAGFVRGWDPVVNLFSFRQPRPTAAQTQAESSAVAPPSAKEAVTDGNSGEDRQDGRRSNRARPKGARRRASGRRNRRR